MTRPDLDAIERRVTDMDAEEDAWRAQLHFAKNARADVLTLLTYCRELEAENRRLREGGERTEAAAMAALHQARSAREEMEKSLERMRKVKRT